MKTFIGVDPNRNRYTLTIASALLLIVMSAWAVAPVEEAKLTAADGAADDVLGWRNAVVTLISARTSADGGSA